MLIAYIQNILFRAVYSHAGKLLWVFVPGKLLVKVKKHLMVSEVNLYNDDIFIM